MKNAKFITAKNWKSFAPSSHNPWINKQYNNRSMKLDDRGGLLTVMKKFDIANVKSAVLRITSLGLFEAMINGKRVGSEHGYDELMPLWTDYNHRVFEVEYDVKKHLKNGENTFAAHISSGWWTGRISFGWYGFKPCALCAELEITKKNGEVELIASDESWQTTVGGPVRTGDIWDGEYFDARIPDSATNPDSYTWENAVLFDGFLGEIVPFEGERVKVNEYIAPISATVYRNTKKNGTEYGEILVTKKCIGDNCEKIKLLAGQHVTLDFGENIVGRPCFAINANDGTEIEFIFAEMLNDSGDPARGNDGPKGSVYTANYRSALSRLFYIASSKSSRKQLNIFRPLHTYYGFRYAEITASRDIEIVCVTGEVLYANMARLGAFECSNAEINKLYSNIERGMKGNYVSVPTDCPQRDERLGWTGDTQIFVGAGSYMVDTYKFMRKWLGDMRDSQKGFDGAYSDVVPRVFGTEERGKTRDAAGAWAEAGLIVPYTMWLMYGDTDIIAEHYDSMEWYLEHIYKRNGLNGSNPRYGDWLAYEETTKEYVSVCYFANSATLMEKFSELLGKTERVEYYKDLRKKIVAHYYDRYVKDGKIVEDTQTAYLLAIAFDLLTEADRETAIESLKRKIIDNDYTLSTGFVGTGILAQTLSKLGLDNLAYSLLLQTKDPSWLYSVRQGATTVWERWNSYTIATGFGAVSMNSFNHYAYGAVAEWMFAGMAGIRPDPECPGFEHIILSPRPDTRKAEEIPAGQERITMVRANYRGIFSRWEYENGEFVWRFKIPNGSARVEFPLINGRKTVNINGVNFTKKELSGEIIGEKLVFELNEGEYIVK